MIRTNSVLQDMRSRRRILSSGPPGLMGRGLFREGVADEDWAGPFEAA